MNTGRFAPENVVLTALMSMETAGLIGVSGLIGVRLIGVGSFFLAGPAPGSGVQFNAQTLGHACGPVHRPERATAP